MKKRVLLVSISFLSVLIAGSKSAFCCGGGIVPYVPTQTGASTSQQYFLMDKGVATDMFDVKNLNTIFRNIILSGNERNKRNTKKTNAEQESNDAVSGKKKDSVTQKDTTGTVYQQHYKQHAHTSTGAEPVLNLYKIH